MPICREPHQQCDCQWFESRASVWGVSEQNLVQTVQILWVHEEVQRGAVGPRACCAEVFEGVGGSGPEKF